MPLRLLTMLLVALLCAGCDSDDNAEGSPSSGGGFSCDREVEAAYCGSLDGGIWACVNLCAYDVDVCGDDACDGQYSDSWWGACSSAAEDYSLDECINLSCFFMELLFYDDTSLCSS